MSELVANNDLEITATPSGAWVPGDPNSASAMTLVKSPADSADAPDGTDVLCDEISWTVIPGACTLSGYTHTSGASVSPIAATAQKCKAKSLGLSKAVLRKGDTGTCNGVFTPPSGPTLACSCTFEITDAGQDKMRAE